MINIEEHREGLVIGVRVSAGASRERVMGEHAGALKVSVAAAPERGKANKAVCELVAKTLGVSRAQVRLVSGETSRDKRLLITGVPRAEVESALKQLI